MTLKHLVFSVVSPVLAFFYGYSAKPWPFMPGALETALPPRYHDLPSPLQTLNGVIAFLGISAALLVDGLFAGGIVILVDKHDELWAAFLVGCLLFTHRSTLGVLCHGFAPRHPPALTPTEENH